MKMFKQISAIVCSAGLSKRMGEQNKLLLPFGSGTIISTTVRHLILSDVSEIILVTGYDHEEIVNSIESQEPKIKIVFNETYKMGHTTSIQKGINNLSEEATAFMICLGDMPLLDKNRINTLIEFHKLNWKDSKKALISRPVVDHHPGHPVIMDISYKEDLINCSDADGCKSVIRKYSESLRVMQSSDKAYITDIDELSDYTQLIHRY